jgi:Rieske Fe-S protein
LEKISREKFVRLAGTLGVGVAAASVAACGGSGGGGSGSGGSNDSGGENKPETSKSSEKKPEQAESGASAIAAESDVAPGNAKKFKDGDEDAVLVHLDSGDFVAYSAVCTHQGCVVAFKDNQLSCPCHGSVFDPANGGEVVTGPAETPLPEIPVKVEGGNVVKA